MSSDKPPRYVTWSAFWTILSGTLAGLAAIGTYAMTAHAATPHEGSVQQDVFSMSADNTRRELNQINDRLGKMDSKIDQLLMKERGQ